MLRVIQARQERCAAGQGRWQQRLQNAAPGQTGDGGFNAQPTAGSDMTRRPWGRSVDVGRTFMVVAGLLRRVLF